MYIAICIMYTYTYSAHNTAKLQWYETAKSKALFQSTLPEGGLARLVGVFSSGTEIKAPPHKCPKAYLVEVAPCGAVQYKYFHTTQSCIPDETILAHIAPWEILDC